MPLLVEVSAGELVDKITILELKLEHIKDPAKLANIRLEHERLMATFREELEECGALAALMQALKAVNGELWQIEDDIRAKERAQAFDADFIALARSVYRMNDRRAGLKREINELLRSAIVEEKSYAAY